MNHLDPFEGLNYDTDITVIRFTRPRGVNGEVLVRSEKLRNNTEPFKESGQVESVTSAFDLLTKDITTLETQKKNEGVKEGIKKDGIPPGSNTKRTGNPNINTTKLSSIRGGQKCETHMLVNE